VPRIHELDVRVGDRDSLLRFAIAARLTEQLPDDRERRGAPAPPPGFGRSQRWLTSALRGETLMDDDTLLGLIENIDKAAQEDRSRLRELYVTFRAATDPHEVTKDVVDRRFWPALRRVPVSRHPVDLVIAGYCAANHALATAATERQASPDGLRQFAVTELPPRDQFAFQRVMNGLVVVALGGYPFSNSAVDLLAVLSRWHTRSIEDSVKTHSGRRLARALDRAVRTYINAGSPRDPSDEAWFDSIVKIAANMLTRSGPHTAASSSAPSLRLARLVLMRHPNPRRDADKSDVRRCLMSLQGLALGDTTDVLLRREAAWYCAEAAPLLEVFPGDSALRSASSLLDELVAVDRNLFDDLHCTAPLLSELRQSHSEDPGSAVWPTRFNDFAVSSAIGLHNWRFGEVTWTTPLRRHLSLDRLPTTRSWRDLTRAVKGPTAALLLELLFTPWSGRARWIAETLRAAGQDVVLAVSETAENMLRDPEILTAQVLAKRAAWTLGFIAAEKPSSVLRTLVDVGTDDSVASDVAADVVWALGDVLASRRNDPLAPSALQALRDLVTNGLAVLADDTALATVGRTEVDSGALVLMQAALHAIAVQHDAASADVLSSAVATLTTCVKQLELTKTPALAYATQHAGQTRRAATWALKQLDAAVALSYQ
jgi:hypothetical protein